MTYELAKKLKDAGFPGKYGINCEWYDESGTRNTWTPPLKDLPEETTTYSYCLGELIEACGDKFNILYYDKLRKKWNAYSNEPKDEVDLEWYHEGEYEVGKTPEEAVANLWLKLNENI